MLLELLLLLLRVGVGVGVGVEVGVDFVAAVVELLWVGGRDGP